MSQTNEKDDDPITQLERQFKRPELKPIDRDIFNKMIFCEEIFRFLNLEETLYFTKLDIDLNSFPRDVSVTE